MEFHLIHLGMICVSLPLTLGRIRTFNPRVPLPKTCQNLNFMPAKIETLSKLNVFKGKKRISLRPEGKSNSPSFIPFRYISLGPLQFES